jgi:hypothetical protein
MIFLKSGKVDATFPAPAGSVIKKHPSESGKSRIDGTGEANAMGLKRVLYFATSAIISTSTVFFGSCIALPVAFGQSGAAPPADNLPGGLEEIVVTAQKRAQNINAVGLTITAISGDTFKNQQINSPADLANAIPGLSYTNSSQGTPVYTLRGIGFYEASLAAYPAVAVYLDEVPLPFPALEKHSAFDLQRVEVLKGPQGTLFGQNSTGGAINYISAKPTNDLVAGVDLGYGNYDTTIDEGFISGPLNDVLSARLALRAERHQRSHRELHGAHPGRLPAERRSEIRVQCQWLDRPQRHPGAAADRQAMAEPDPRCGGRGRTVLAAGSDLGRLEARQHPCRQPVLAGVAARRHRGDGRDHSDLAQLL